jgi:hypothetical protein
MGERIGRIGQMETDFSLMRMLEIREKSKKEIRFHPPDPPNPFSHLYHFFPKRKWLFEKFTRFKPLKINHLNSINLSKSILV